MGRRGFLRGTTAVATAGVVAGVSTPAVAQSGEVDFEAFFGNVDNYDGVVDETGTESVGVEVGTAANGGAFGFGPAAVRVDPGATVTWTWTGGGGLHNVAATDGSFESDLVSAAGETFEHTFDMEGVFYYVCTPHESLGMKGAIVVGDVAVGPAELSALDVDYNGWFDGVAGFEGTVDATGEETVTVSLSADGGSPAFDPLAIHVDSGTTVVWEHDGGDREHVIVADDGSYESAVLAETGDRYAVTFEGDGVSKYYCANHEAERGAVVVGAGVVTETVVTPLGLVATGGVLAAFAYAVYGHFKETMEQGRTVEARERARRKPRMDPDAD